MTETGPAVVGSIGIDDLAASGEQRYLLHALRSAHKTGNPLGPKTLEFLIDYFSRYRHTRQIGRPAGVSERCVRRRRRPVDPIAVATFFAGQELAKLRKRFGSGHKVETAGGHWKPILEVAAAAGVERLARESDGRYSGVDPEQVYLLLRRPADRRRHVQLEYEKFCIKKSAPNKLVQFSRR